jgi:hypothetical protein
VTPVDVEDLKRQNAMSLRALMRVKQQLAVVQAERDALRQQLTIVTAERDDLLNGLTWAKSHQKVGR